ncbi:hypothetical protein ABFS83_14G052000 [Erythranthe nasuta]
MSERSYSPSPPRSSRGDSPIILLVRNLRLDYTRGRSRSRYSSESPPRNSQSPPTRRYLSRSLSRSHYSSQSPPYNSLSPPPTRRYSSRGLSRSRYSSQSPPYNSLPPPPTRRYSRYNVIKIVMPFYTSMYSKFKVQIRKSDYRFFSHILTLPLY